jgi:hypothetical protein
MNDFVLDTNICIYWLKGKHEIRRKIEQVGTDHLKITIIDEFVKSKFSPPPAGGD